MEKRILEYLNMQNETENRNKAQAHTACAPVPACIDDNFCTAAPGDKNGGVLTMVFVDMQPLENLYPAEISFNNGTLFPNLNKPFFGGR